MARNASERRRVLQPAAKPRRRAGRADRALTALRVLSAGKDDRFDSRTAAGGSRPDPRRRLRQRTAALTTGHPILELRRRFRVRTVVRFRRVDDHPGGAGKPPVSLSHSTKRASSAVTRVAFLNAAFLSALYESQRYRTQPGEIAPARSRTTCASRVPLRTRAAVAAHEDRTAQARQSQIRCVRRMKSSRGRCDKRRQQPPAIASCVRADREG